MTALFVGQIIGLLTFIPGFTVGIRRLHDINRSGKWVLIAYLPFIITIVFIIMAFTTRMFFLIFIGLLFPLAGAVILLIWAFKEGDHGSNHYGHDPKTTTTRHITAKRASARKPVRRKTTRR